MPATEAQPCLGEQESASTVPAPWRSPRTSGESKAPFVELILQPSCEKRSRSGGSGDPPRPVDSSCPWRAAAAVQGSGRRGSRGLAGQSSARAGFATRGAPRGRIGRAPGGAGVQERCTRLNDAGAGAVA